MSNENSGAARVRDISPAIANLKNEDKAAAESAAKSVTEALTEALTRPARLFNTHSQALAGRLMAEQHALNELVADIDDQIKKLNEQRTDAMLASSMISGALTAAEKNRSS